jgi:hypothetical protein
MPAHPAPGSLPGAGSNQPAGALLRPVSFLPLSSYIELRRFAAH